MALKTFVYIRDVENLSDARYCAGMGVDMIGFRLDSSIENALEETTFREISNWISGVKIVGEFGHTPTDKIKSLLSSTEVDYLQAPGLSTLPDYASLDKPVILHLELCQDINEHLAALDFAVGQFDYLLITSQNPSLDEHQKEIIKKISLQHPVILGFGINEQNVESIVAELGLEGISLTGSSEIRPGYKDYDELADILEVLEED